jgi:hypothetical protein
VKKDPALPNEDDTKKWTLIEAEDMALETDGCIGFTFEGEPYADGKPDQTATGLHFISGPAKKFFVAMEKFEEPIVTVTVTNTEEVAGSFVVGNKYQIIALGDTTPAQWTMAGVDGTATAGSVFVAKAVGTGTGTASVLKEWQTYGTCPQSVFMDPLRGWYAQYTDKALAIVTRSSSLDWRDAEIVAQ